MTYSAGWGGPMDQWIGVLGLGVGLPAFPLQPWLTGHITMPSVQFLCMRMNRPKFLCEWVVSVSQTASLPSDSIRVFVLTL